MYYGHAQAGGWNIFARELQNVLRRYNLDLNSLNSRVGIHPEKVRRLAQSLRSPESFPVLNVDEMDRLIAVLNPAQGEIIQLRAAILATSIERTLMDRINQDDALKAADQVFPMIFQALEDEAESDEGLGNVRGDNGGVYNSGPDSAFASIFDSVDDGDRALQMGNALSDPIRRNQYAQSAYNAYEEALTQLNILPRYLQSGQTWRDLQQEAQRGKITARRRLTDA